MIRSSFALAILVVLALGFASPSSVKAQRLSTAEQGSSQTAREASIALQNAKQTHLWRVAGWGGLNTLGGLALMWGASRSRPSARWHFGAMTVGWGAVNVGIATLGLLSLPPSPSTDPAAVLAAERQFHDILLFNLGLNVAYSAVGATMLGAGYRGVANAERWRGFGSSLIVQGAGLLVLDGIAFFASRSRLATLLDSSTSLSLHVLPTGAALTLHL